jgi:multidrug efflux pump subunit AcrA (membrane-fusion protein)
MNNRSPVIWTAVILIWTLTLTACSAFGTPTPQPLPTIVLDNGNPTPNASSGAASLAQGGGVTASGIVMPVQAASLAFTQGGKVKTVNVAVGDQVKAGQVLVELDTTDIQIEVNQARRHFQELTSQASIAAAELAVANAQQAVIDTQKKVVGLKWPRASDTLIQNTEAQIDLARDALTKATDDFRGVQDLPDGDPRKAAAQLAMTNAQLNLNRLIGTVNWYEGKPSDIDVALAYGNLDASKAALQEAQWYLALIMGQPVPNTATGSNLAEVEQAIVDLTLAQKKLDDARLVTFIPGTVISVDAVPGEIVPPGKVLVEISDDTRLHVETTDLSERDVPKIAIGQTVQVLVKALNQTITGRVTRISPLADTLGGDVVYKTTVDLDTPPSGLRAGMSVEVQFGTAQ